MATPEGASSGSKLQRVRFDPQHVTHLEVHTPLGGHFLLTCLIKLQRMWSKFLANVSANDVVGTVSVKRMVTVPNNVSANLPIAV